MSTASAASPFSTIVDDVPWITWCCKTPVSTLKQQEQTDGRSVSDQIEEQNIPEVDDQPYHTQPTYVQHNQYNAVLARINHASRKTGCFSAWKT